MISQRAKLVSFFNLFFSFSTGFDLNLPLDEFGAIDFDYLQNLSGNFLTLYFHFLIMYKTVANKNNIYFSL